MGSPVRGGRGRGRQPDDASERVHDDQHGRQLPGGLARAASVARGVPGCTTAPGPKWNAASGDSQGWQEWVIDLDAYARPDGRDLDLLRERLGGAGPRRLHRRHHPARRLVDLVRGRRHWRLGRRRASARQRAEREQLRVHDAAGFPEGAAITTEDTLLLGFGLEARHRGRHARGGHGPRDGLPARRP